MDILYRRKSTVTQDVSSGGCCFGYVLVPVEASDKPGHDAPDCPRTICIVDPPTAKLVIEIFNWFASEGRTSVVHSRT
jgi:hypothetical protein